MKCDDASEREDDECGCLGCMLMTLDVVDDGNGKRGFAMELEGNLVYYCVHMAESVSLHFREAYSTAWS